MSEGFIKLYRQLLDWEWYTDINTKILFIHCLLKANYKTKKYQKNTVKKGSFVTSLESLSKETGLTVQQIRTALNHLISTGELTSESSNKNRIITVVNYEKFQNDNKQTNKQTTGKQQATNNSRRKKESNIIPYGDNITEKKETTATPSTAEDGGGLPGVKEVREFAEGIEGSNDSLACRFRYVFEESGTRMPDAWQELYRRFVKLSPQEKHDFLDDVAACKYKEKWGTL